MNKYKAEKTVVDGITFDSKWESERYLELKQLALAHHIEKFERQAKFELKVGARKVATIKLDYKYCIAAKPKQWVVEDAKGYPDPTWPIRAKLFLAIYGDHYLFIESKRTHANRLTLTKGGRLKRTRLEWGTHVGQ